jgi:hypothetical protein
MQQLKPIRTFNPLEKIGGRATQIGIDRFDKGNRGIKMRLDTIDDRSSQSDVRRSQGDSRQKSLLTPARQAALEALEREFSELLNSLPR